MLAGRWQLCPLAAHRCQRPRCQEPVPRHWGAGTWQARSGCLGTGSPPKTTLGKSSFSIFPQKLDLLKVFLKPSLSPNIHQAPDGRTSSTHQALDLLLKILHTNHLAWPLHYNVHISVKTGDSSFLLHNT